MRIDIVLLMRRSVILIILRMIFIMIIVMLLRFIVRFVSGYKRILSLVGC